MIGRVFWRGPVRELLDGVSPDFAALEARDFIRRRPASSIAGEREFAIKHALTREVAYESLPKTRRARLHAAFAEWLERIGDGRDEHASFLAHHYAEAVRPEDADLAWAGEQEELERLRAKALGWLRRAGELAVGRYDVRGIAAFVAGEYDLGRAWAERRFELLGELSDPDSEADITATPISGCIWSGRFREARRLASRHDEITRPLTPHHRVHGVAVLGEVEELTGSWESIRELEERTVQAVEANADTPCIRNPRSLLVCAVARAHLGDEARARSLEERAEELGMEGYAEVLDTPRLRLALARGDLARVEELLAREPAERGWYRGWLSLSSLVTRLDGLATVGDRQHVEAVAERHLRPRTYTEPFALRALGVVREDEDLLAQALARFVALGLDWQAARTRALLGP